MEKLLSPRVCMAAFLALGFFASAYLLVVYVTGGPIACGAAGGCETVRASRWAMVGPIPLPAFGVAFYAGMLAMLVLRALSPWRERLLHRLTLLAAFLAVAESVYLFFVQWLSIEAFCLWCLASGFATLGAFAFALFDRSSLTEAQRLADLRGYAIVLGILAVLGAPAVWLLTRAR